ncbi:TspO/MBR-related protein [Geranomyces variabilis]|nr:TspO/MBR-related protein [Geranomyces variabilis]KAJ3140600.1 hypothetical protein HDU90_007902 [Geranomyces variabilis]
MPSVLELVNRPLITAVCTPLVLGMAAGLTTRTSVKTWYPTLSKPSWTPPNWVFPVAWTTLYTTMGVAAHLVAVSPAPPPLALPLYAGQLVLNLIWTPLFFGAHLLGAATFDIAVLFGAAVATAVEFYKADERAGYLMAPYCAWIAYAGSISAYVWWNNSARKGGKGGRKEL